jgi:hypothetical protein
VIDRFGNPQVPRAAHVVMMQVVKAAAATNGLTASVQLKATVHGRTNPVVSHSTESHRAVMMTHRQQKGSVPNLHPSSKASPHLQAHQ